MSPVAQIDNAAGVETLSFLHTDHLYTPRFATDTNGAIVWRWEGQAFGESADESLNGLVYNLRFPGQYFDVETGLYYNWFRDYLPGVGRYGQSDPIGLNGGINTYGYVGGSPLSRFDPFGLFTWRDAAGFVPVLGSGLDAYDAFKCGNIGMGFLNLGLAAMDLTGVGAIAKGVTVGTMKFAARNDIWKAFKNTNNWNNMRGRLQRAGVVTKNSRSTPKAQQVTTDHIFFKQRHGAPHWLTNHPANLQTDVPQSLNSRFEHMRPLKRAGYLPNWMKLGTAGAASSSAGLAIDSGCECQ